MIRKGFTLIELLVALGVASMVFLLTSSVLITVITANAKAVKMEEFEKVKNDIGTELSTAIRWADNIQISEDVVVADGVKYHVDSGRLYKNSLPISPTGVNIGSFEVKNFSTNPDYKSISIFIEMTNNHKVLSSDSIKIVVSQRMTEVAYE